MEKSTEAFRTISEAADELEIAKHVLRFWEVKFGQIRPMKRGGGRRYYRPEDMELLRGIRHLLHFEGYTIKGVQKIFREQGQEIVKRFGRDGAAAASTPTDAAPVESQVPVAAPKTEAGAPGKTGSRRSKAVPADAKAAAPGAGISKTEAIRAVIKGLEECRALLAGSKETIETPERTVRRA